MDYFALANEHIFKDNQYSSNSFNDYRDRHNVLWKYRTRHRSNTTFNCGADSRVLGLSKNTHMGNSSIQPKRQIKNCWNVHPQESSRIYT